MTDLSFTSRGKRTKKTVMETIMKPLSLARRSARWLMAAGIALAAMPVPSASALVVVDPANPELRIPDGVLTHPDHGDVQPFFTKKGHQRGCDYVIYDLRFGMRGNPDALAEFGGILKNLRLDFRDQLPAGLEIVNVQFDGDGTNAVGGPLPAPSVGTTTNPNDTASIADFRISATDLDGQGTPHERYVDIRITAQIDHSAFPAPAFVDNQGFVKMTVIGGGIVDVPSHDPSLPDDADFKTGDPTRIRIDVTGCEPPPPPPGDEACFKVERGDVDCVPGGGAYIYNMPVGPELGGKWVQLRTTTPGITVDPALQLVPAGGGVLHWEITGASPGDVIHLIVTGIETYAGPEEGVGLCCSQTVDIVIPPDLRCPPERGEPDIEVLKKADVLRCTPLGGCNFTITVTNVGDAPYNGKIVLDEVTTPGNAAVVSGPNAPWTCLPMTSPMSCEHPATTLDPGESVQLKLGFAPGPGWESRWIRNCAAFDYTASGHPDVFGRTDNDRDCDRIPICKRGDRECNPPEVQKKVDLRITKDPRTVACSAAGVCEFDIRVYNNGDETYSGPLTVIDTYPTGAPSSSAFGPTPPWGCVPDGVGQFRCEHPGMNLVSGGFVTLHVRAIVPADYPSQTIRNCGEVKPIPDETVLGNNKACADMRIPNRNPGQPALRITKTCDGAVAGAAVHCRITVWNGGTAAPSGPVRVADAATLIGSGTPTQVLTVTPDGPEWNCGPVPADSLSCRIPGEVMTPGTSRYFDVTVAVSPNQRFENCAMGSYGPAPGNDIVYPFGKDCAEGGATISVKKTGDAQCEFGQPCTFEITFSNDGPTDFSGPVRIGDAIGVDGFGRLEGVAISSIEPPFGCSPEPTTLPLSCVANLSLRAGESRVHQVTVVIPDDGRFANANRPLSAENCIGAISPDTPVASIAGSLAAAPSGQDEKGRHYACHRFTLERQQKQECSVGFVMNDAGRCVCPDGTSFRNGQCSPDKVSDPVVPPKQKQCTLLPGQIRTENGRCVCPQGTELKNGKCVKDEPPVRQCTLLPGMIRTDDGRCVCPRGTELDDGKCVPHEPPVRQCTLLPGQIRTQDGRCICPRGTELKRGKCVKDEPPVRQCTLLPGQIRTEDGRCICPRGTELKRGKCVKDEPPVRQCKLLPGQIRTEDGRCVCPRGTELKRGKCVKDEPPVRQCKLLPGQIRTENGRCVCPRGTELIRGACRKINDDPVCRKGQVLKNGRCIDIPRCKAGTFGTPPNCRPLELERPRLRNPNLQFNPNLRLAPRQRDQGKQEFNPNNIR